MKAAIAIDKHKLATFTRHLKMAGFSYEQLPGFTSDTYLLTVETTNQQQLAQVCLAANTECTKSAKK